jgi:isopenicillin-N epimerase
MGTPTTAFSEDIRKVWGLDPEIHFLNHGSFGACPIAVLEHQTELRDRIERQPVRFFLREMQAMLDDSRQALAGFVGASPADLVFLANATTGVNTALRSMNLEAGDEVLVTNQEYNACRNALNEVAAVKGVKVVVVEIPFPVDGRDLVDSFVAAVTPKTRLLLIDHVISQTAMVLPLNPIVAKMNELGIDTIVDGAHAPGMLPLNLDELGATYYTGNCHKWMCAPKGIAFLHVRHDRRTTTRPLVISHGANAQVSLEDRFHQEFDWMGTSDPSAVLSLPFLISYMDGLVEGGWDFIMRHNHALALEARDILCAALEVEPACPEDMVGSMVAVPLPAGKEITKASVFFIDPLQDRLLFEHQIEVPIIPWPNSPQRLIRLSAQLYNSRSQYEALAAALPKLLAD